MKRSRHRRPSGWTEGVRAVEVGDRLMVVPYWEAPYVASDRIKLVLDPGPAFGIGNHPSTLMALELLEQVLGKRDRAGFAPTLLDVGTGTGCLAVAAKLLGAGFTVAFDIDSASLFTVRRNLELNGLGFGRDNNPLTVHLFVGDGRSVGGKFDVVVANLAGPLLRDLADYLVAVSGSVLILSGIADPVLDSVVEAYGRPGMKVMRILSRGGWNAAVLDRSGK